MLEQDFGKLDEQATRRNLDGLEAGIWAGVEARRQALRLSKFILSCQAAVLVVGFLFSAVAGARFVSAQGPENALRLFSTGSDLSPSVRLAGF
jgi:hypothetical protein